MVRNSVWVVVLTAVGLTGCWFDEGEFRGSNNVKTIQKAATAKGESTDFSCSLSLSHESIELGEKITLKFNFPKNTDSAELDGIAIALPKEELRFTPPKTKTFIAKIKSDDGEEATCKIRVKVKSQKPQGPACNLVASPETVVVGGDSKIIFATAGDIAQAFVDDEEVAPVGVEFERTIAQNTTILGRVIGENGEEETCEITVRAYRPPNPVQQTTIGKDINRKPLNMMFILDDSFSMTDNRDQVANALDQLVDRLKNEDVEFSARFLPMSKVINRLSNRGTSEPGYDGEKYVAFGSYSGIGTFTHNSTVNQMKNYIKGFQSTDERNELGICLAMDYYNLYKNTFADSERDLQIVFVSDEDNDRDHIEGDPFDPTAPETKRLVYCSREEQSCAETERWSYYKEWTEYKYDYRDVFYKVELAQPSTCMEKGYQRDPHELKDLRTTKGCATKRYECTDNGTVTKTECEVPRSTDVRTYNSDYTQYDYCEWVRYYECTGIFDGEEDTRLLLRHQVKPEYECTMKWDEGVDLRFTLPSQKTINGQPNPEIRDCGPCTAKDWRDFTWVERDYQNNLANPNPDIVCNNTPIDDNWYPRAKMKYEQEQIPGTSPIKFKLSRVFEDACPAHYHPYTLPNPRTFGWDFCEQEIEELPGGLPTSVTQQDSGSVQSTWQTQYLRYNVAKTLAEATAIAKTRWNVTDDNLIRVTLVHDKVITDRVLHYRQFPPGHDARNDPSFSETITEHRYREDEPAYRDGPSNYGNLEQVTEDDGVRERCIRYETVGNERRPTPANLQAILDPGMKNRYKVHGIINEDGNACANSPGAQVEQGFDYQTLISNTSGVTGDICQPNFGPFMQEMATNILEVKKLTIDRTYPSATYDIVSIRNKTTGNNLTIGSEVFIEGETLRFKEDVISVGDKILVEYVAK